MLISQKTTPIKVKFVTNTPKCLAKSISQAITTGSKLMYNKIEYYHFKTLILKHSGQSKTIKLSLTK